MTELFNLVYISQSAIPADTESVTSEIESILNTSRTFNAQNNISGALMYSHGFFYQVLEGQMLALEKLMRRIERDRRHTNVQIVRFAPVDLRHFHGWAMALAGINPDLPESVKQLLVPSDQLETDQQGLSLVKILRQLVDIQQYRETE